VSCFIGNQNCVRRGGLLRKGLWKKGISEWGESSQPQLLVMKKLASWNGLAVRRLKSANLVRIKDLYSDGPGGGRWEFAGL